LSGKSESETGKPGINAAVIKFSGALDTSVFEQTKSSGSGRSDSAVENFQYFT